MHQENNRVPAIEEENVVKKLRTEHYKKLQEVKVKIYSFLHAYAFFVVILKLETIMEN